MYEVPNWTAPTRTIWGQTKLCIAKSMCEISALLRYYATKSGHCILMFQDNLSDPSSKVKKSKIERRAQLKINDNIFFFFFLSFFLGVGLCFSSHFFHFLKMNVLEARSVSFFMQRST